MIVGGVVVVVVAVSEGALSDVVSLASRPIRWASHAPRTLHLRCLLVFFRSIHVSLHLAHRHWGPAQLSLVLGLRGPRWCILEELYVSLFSPDCDAFLYQLCCVVIVMHLEADNRSLLSLSPSSAQPFWSSDCLLNSFVFLLHRFCQLPPSQIFRHWDARCD